MPVEKNQYRKEKQQGREPPPPKRISFCPKLRSQYASATLTVIRFHTYAEVRMRVAGTHAFWPHPAQDASAVVTAPGNKFPGHKKTGTHRDPVERSSLCPKSRILKGRRIHENRQCAATRTHHYGHAQHANPKPGIPVPLPFGPGCKLRPAVLRALPNVPKKPPPGPDPDPAHTP